MGSEGKINAIREYFDRVNQEKMIPTISTHILMKKGEVAHLQDNVKLYEIRTARKSTRGGAAMRILKGVFIGGSRGTSRGHDELREIDNGKLILTNKRIIFDGCNNTRNISLDKIVSVSEYSDGIEISIEDKTKSQTYVGMPNPLLWKSLVYFIRQIPESGELPTAKIEIQLT
jgi:hypothetical protein